ALGGVELHGRAVDLHPVGLRMDAGAELGHDASVDAHPARDDVLLAHATGRDPGGREHLLEALALGRVLVLVGHRAPSSSNPSTPSGSRGEMGGSSSSELMPSWVSSSGVVS